MIVSHSQQRHETKTILFHYKTISKSINVKCFVCVCRYFLDGIHSNTSSEYTLRCSVVRVMLYLTFIYLSSYTHSIFVFFCVFESNGNHVGFGRIICAKKGLLLFICKFLSSLLLDISLDFSPFSYMGGLTTYIRTYVCICLKGFQQ